MTETRLSIIVAAAENGVIGRAGAMPWRMPSDLKHFRALTIGKPVIMGRKTFQSLGKPLEGRANLVVSRDPAFAAPGIEKFSSLDDALARARVIAVATGAGEIMIIGGGEIYRLVLPIADRIYLTRILAKIDGDATFPLLDPGTWSMVCETQLAPSPRDDYGAKVLVFERAAQGR